jgi:large subunit ribosomal protein L23
MKNLYAVIRRPIITEKGNLQKEASRKVTFEVHPDANKQEIKAAVEKAFKVRVVSVRSLNQLGKMKRVGRFQGRRRNWKKAIVTLGPNDKIEFFEGV